jgi:endonuclease-3
LRAERLGRRVRAGLDRLEAAFGRPRLGRRYRPLDELVLTVLSQNTNDRNRDRAFAALRRRYADWDAVLAAAPDDVEATIRVGGLARTKARVIREILRRIRAERGDLDLDFLRRIPAAEARDYLARFKGVGEKTICCVLLFSCGHPAFPVDTHVHRVTRRLGWVPGKATPATSHAVLGRIIPTDRYYTGHVNLITLGRRICRARNPDCPSCPLRRGCRFAATRSPRPRPASRRAGRS